MLIHGVSFDPDYKLGATDAAARDEEQHEGQQDDQTRKKPLPASPGESEAGEECIVTLQGSDDGQEQAPPQDHPDCPNDPKPSVEESPGDAPFSDYA